MASIPTTTTTTRCSQQQPSTLRTFTQSVTQYRKRFNNSDDGLQPDQDQQASATAQRKNRKENAASMADEYYDFATPAFLSNWSPSFHYTPFSPEHQTLREAQLFYQHRLAHFLQLKPTDLVLDVGCGIGAPAMEIARLTGCKVVGISINQRQINIARAEARRQNLLDLHYFPAGDNEDDGTTSTTSTSSNRTHVNGTGGCGRGCGRNQCTFIRADFHHLPFPDNTFDAAYAIEATCHAADLAAVYKEIARVVKKKDDKSSTTEKRNCCAISEWVLTDTFDPCNPEHIRVRDRIERGNGLANLPTVDQARGAFREAGLRITHDEDFARHFDYAYYYTCEDDDDHHDGDNLKGGGHFENHPKSYRPWYLPLNGTLAFLNSSSSLADIWRTVKLHPLFYRVGYAIVSVLHITGLYPPRVIDAMETMKDAVDGVTEGGELGILSPAWWFVGTWADDFDTLLQDVP